MRQNLSVKVPYNKESAYTLFAQGLKIEKPWLDKNGEFLHFKFSGGTAVALFYTFGAFRRAYLVSAWQDERDGEPLFLPGADKKLFLIAKLKGRKIDNLKRLLHLLSREDEFAPFRIPLAVWQRLAALLACKTIKKSYVDYLLSANSCKNKEGL